MPIVSVDKDSIVQVCTECKSTASVSRSDLVLGHVHDDASDPNLIALPPCKCGAREFLNRTFDHAPEHLAAHRKKVNALAIDLKARGQLHPQLADRIRAEKHTPAQVGELIGAVGSVAPPVPNLAMMMQHAALTATRKPLPPDPERDARRAARLSRGPKRLTESTIGAVKGVAALPAKDGSDA